MRKVETEEVPLSFNFKVRKKEVPGVAIITHRMVDAPHAKFNMIDLQVGQLYISLSVEDWKNILPVIQSRLPQ